MVQVLEQKIEEFFCKLGQFSLQVKIEHYYYTQ
jgi:hypothetical protein